MTEKKRNDWHKIEITPKEMWEIERQIDSATQHLLKALGIVRKYLIQRVRKDHDTTPHKQVTLQSEE
jgi:hypothetical protein